MHLPNQTESNQHTVDGNQKSGVHQRLVVWSQYFAGFSTSQVVIAGFLPSVGTPFFFKQRRHQPLSRSTAPYSDPKWASFGCLNDSSCAAAGPDRVDWPPRQKKTGLSFPISAGDFCSPTLKVQFTKVYQKKQSYWPKRGGSDPSWIVK